MASAREVRLRDLLCHRTGLARHEWLWYRAPWTVEESVRRMAHLEPHTSFRSTYEYNNLGYLEAGGDRLPGELAAFQLNAVGEVSQVRFLGRTFERKTGR